MSRPSSVVAAVAVALASLVAAAVQIDHDASGAGWLAASLSRSPQPGCALPPASTHDARETFAVAPRPAHRACQAAATTAL